MKSKQVVKIVDNIVSVVLILFVLVSGSIAIFFSYNRLQNNMVYVFGYSVCYVLTGSMEPSISKGDMILIKKVSDVSTIKKGDIITFKRTQGVLAGQNVTHRVESVEKNGNQYYFFTKGDANSAPDSQIVLQQEILGVYQKKHLF
jgi:signal peptidase